MQKTSILWWQYLSESYPSLPAVNNSLKHDVYVVQIVNFRRHLTGTLWPSSISGNYDKFEEISEFILGFFFLSCGNTGSDRQFNVRALLTHCLREPGVPCILTLWELQNLGGNGLSGMSDINFTPTTIAPAVHPNPISPNPYSLPYPQLKTQSSPSL